MDIQRPDLAKKRRSKRILYSVLGGVALICITAALFSYEPGPYKVDRAQVWIGEVTEGAMLREVRGNGTLVPAEIRWVAAETSGRIERILVLPGSQVVPDTVIMELSNPQLVQDAEALELQLSSEEANFVSFEVNLQSNLLQLKSSLAQTIADFEQAVLEHEMTAELYQEGLESKLNWKRAELRENQLKSRVDLEKQLFEFQEKAVNAQLDGQRSSIDRTRAQLALLKTQIEGLRVKAGFAGILQRQDVEEGQQVGPGTNLSQVANPNSLKAVLQVSEHQAKDVAIGQVARIDTRNGIVPGEVIRVDPNVENGTVAVDIRLPRELPRGARPDLTIEGFIEIERIAHTLYVDRPVFARSESTTTIFRMEPDTEVAERIPVEFGRSSANTIEVLKGLGTGDRIILSDTSDWERYDKIQIN